MKYIQQIGIILAISFVGEILNALIPLPIPASVYGMVILFLLLQFKVIAFERVREGGLFIKNNLVLALIPSAVGVMAAWDVLGPILIPAILIILASSIAVFACAGLTAQAIVRAKERRKSV